MPTNLKLIHNIRTILDSIFSWKIGTPHLLLLNCLRNYLKAIKKTFVRHA